MNVTVAFNDYQSFVNAPPEEVREARRRRDQFRDALEFEADVVVVVPLGSLARGTHRRPIHDVDLVVVYDEASHPEWGLEGASAGDALSYVGGRINALLGATSGAVAKEVRLGSPRNHAVKCFLDDPGQDGAFTVDVMPAFRRNGMLLVPESRNRRWIYTNPEYLIDEVEARHSDWNKYAGLVRMLKAWAGNKETKIKSLVMEVLALKLLEEAGNRPVALKNFFVKAAWHIENGNVVTDPAGVCGPIQDDLDYDAFADALTDSADLAAAAMSSASNNDQRGAILRWGQVFGDGFPDPPPPASPPGGPGPLPGVTPLAPLVPGEPEPPTRRPIRDTPQG